MGSSKANIFIGKYEPKLDGGGGGRAIQTKILCVDIFSNNTIRIIGTRREFVSVLFCLEVPEFFRVTFSLIDRHCPVVFSRWFVRHFREITSY